ncbi:MAG: helix-turn-helix domain-containing protein [Acidobacteria bacterium]|nr:helix-turn-helix domain-containing protein [Acidobacteriota bacterium]
MAALNTAKIIRRVRQKLEVSQEGLSRLLNATKGAIQHWERGRNNPDLARLLALRQLCPPGPERKDLEALIRQMQAEVAPVRLGVSAGKVEAGGARSVPLPPVRPNENLVLLRRDNAKLRRTVEKLESALAQKSERIRILDGVCAELQREIGRTRAAAPVRTPPAASESGDSSA